MGLRNRPQIFLFHRVTKVESIPGQTMEKQTHIEIEIEIEIEKGWGNKAHWVLGDVDSNHG